MDKELENEEQQDESLEILKQSISLEVNEIKENRIISIKEHLRELRTEIESAKKSFLSEVNDAGDETIVKKYPINKERIESIKKEAIENSSVPYAPLSNPIKISEISAEKLFDTILSCDQITFCKMHQRSDELMTCTATRGGLGFSDGYKREHLKIYINFQQPLKKYEVDRIHDVINPSYISVKCGEYLIMDDVLQELFIMLKDYYSNYLNLRVSPDGELDLSLLEQEIEEDPADNFFNRLVIKFLNLLNLALPGSKGFTEQDKDKIEAYQNPDDVYYVLDESELDTRLSNLKNIKITSM